LIQDNCGRLGVISVEPTSTLDFRPSTFDRVLVDAPCSNTGVLRRRVDLRWRIQPAEIERLRTMQLRLLREATKYLKPGGILVYSTCSLEVDENAKVLEEFLTECRSSTRECQRVLIPMEDGVDGAYAARLVQP
jgi:16S rRNA (cytosine967-C5)-methyltransferase